MSKLNFQRRVLKHLKEMGFNCVVQPKPAFPNIIAWKPFINSQGLSPVLSTQILMGDKVEYQQFIPFFVTLVECKDKKYLSKKEKTEAELLLRENRCNTFLVAYGDKKKLEFQELKLKKTEIKSKKTEIKSKSKETTPSYLG